MFLMSDQKGTLLLDNIKTTMHRVLFKLSFYHVLDVSGW